ncbi:hypothetical protein JR316_0003305 [Psilocybe cubensis]|uniref:Uncharacterized protein n=2 Tax=Psilocybe cubensis TaxID=181762 RepID=A0ACB8H832_PSICU|nr:hypothetical protein JR316_0003305 [Psilocybe cubensis]KAH9483827.1 hypothetical protein JR316_0003305 [Psilocybe cubensis]
MSQSATNPSEQVVTQNQRLFNKYANVFKTADPVHFVSHTRKLATWLSDYKAYYDDARPEIVRLLMIAQNAVKAHLGIQDIQTPFRAADYPNDIMVLAYVQLVAAVEPFTSYFSREPGILAHVQEITATIHAPRTLTLQNQTVSYCTSAQPSMPEVDPTRSNDSDPDVMIIEKPPGFKDAKSVQITPSSSNTISRKPSATLTKPKIKKRKTIDFNVLVDYDLKGLEEKKGGKASGDSDASKAASEVQPSVTPHADHQADAELSVVHQESQNAYIPAGEPPKEKEEPFNVASIPLIDLQKVSEPNVQDANISMSLPLDSPQQFTVAVISTSAVETTSKGVTAPERSVNEASVPLINSEGQQSDDIQANQAEQTQPIFITRVPSTESGEITENDIENIDESAPTVDEPPADANQPSDEASTTGPPSQCAKDPAPHQTCKDPTSTRSSKEPFPSQLSDDSDSIDSPDAGKFGSKRIQIITQQVGGNVVSGIRSRFTLTEDYYERILKWAHYQAAAGADTKLADDALCITIGSYMIDDLKEFAQAGNCDSFEAQISFCPCKWPQEGLSLEYNDDQYIPLSPPLRVTPENLFDICPFVQKGANEIILRQRTDLTQYMFTLQAHYPTKAQIFQVKQNHKKQKEWSEWVETVTRPLTFHFAS